MKPELLSNTMHVYVFWAQSTSHLDFMRSGDRRAIDVLYGLKECRLAKYQTHVFIGMSGALPEFESLPLCQCASLLASLPVQPLSHFSQQNPQNRGLWSTFSAASIFHQSRIILSARHTPSSFRGSATMRWHFELMIYCVVVHEL